MSPSRRIALALLGADLGLFALFFAVALAGHTATIVVPILALRWELASAGLETIRWFPAVHLLASILAVASVPGETEEIVVKVAAPAVVISALVAAAALIFGPICESGLDYASASSRRFSDYFQSARLDLDAGRLEASRIDMEILASISAKDPRLDSLKRRLSGLEAKAAKAAAESKETLPDPVSAKAALLKARAYYKKGDWYNANWQATLALRLDSSLLEAKRLAALAWEEIGRATGSTPKDEAEAVFFAEKFRGYSLLQSEDFIGAWRVFSTLAATHPDDPEVKRYLRSSLAGIDRTAFYRDEADDAFAAASVPRFFLRYRDAGRERIIAAVDSGWTDGAGYFKDVEFLDVAADGTALLVRAPWAKATGGRLFFVAADRSTPGNAFRPEAFSIAAGASSAEARSVTAPASVEIGLKASELQLVAEARRHPASLRMTDVFSALSKTANWGMTSETLVTDIVSRIGTPFASFGTAIVGLLLGLRFRPGTGAKGRGFSLPSVPFIIILTFGAWALIDRLDAVSGLWCARLLPGMDAVWLSAGFRVLFVVAGVVLVAGATNADTEAKVLRDLSEE